MGLFSKTQKPRKSRNISLAVNDSILPKLVLLSAEVIPEYESTGDGGGYFPADNEVMTEAPATADLVFPDSGWDQATSAAGDWGPGSEDSDVPGAGSMASDMLDWFPETDTGWENATSASGDWDQVGDGGDGWDQATSAAGDWGPQEPKIDAFGPPDLSHEVHINPITGWRYDTLRNGIIMATPPGEPLVFPDEEFYRQFDR